MSRRANLETRFGKPRGSAFWARISQPLGLGLASLEAQLGQPPNLRLVGLAGSTRLALEFGLFNLPFSLDHPLILVQV